MPEPLHLLIQRGVLLDIGVRLRDIGLGLVVVVVGDEVLDGVVGEELAQLSRSASQATVAVFPVPVAPRSTTSCSPERMRRSNSAMAAGWSPEGEKSAAT